MKIIHTHPAWLTNLALLFLFMLSFPIQSYGRDVSFSWTANSEPSIIGYHLYSKEGLDSNTPYGNTPIQIDGADTTTYTVTGLSPDKTYQFVLTAYDNVQESDYSAIAIVYSNPSPEILGITTK